MNSLIQIFWFVGWPLAYLFFRVPYHLRIEGRKNIPWRGPVVLVANHQSYFDPTLVGLVAEPRPVRSLARATLFNNPLFAGLIRSLGAVPIRQQRADPAAMKTLVELLNDGRAVMLFPEGQRTPDGLVHEFQRGLLLVLKRAGAPVVPVAIEGAFDVYPRGRSKPTWSGRIRVRAAAPIDCDELMADGPDAALERLRQSIETMRLELREKIRADTNGRFPPPGPADRPYWDTAGNDEGDANPSASTMPTKFTARS